MTIPELYKAYLQSSGVSTDTRNIKPGNIYFALKGEQFDGNRFARKALEAGAGLAIIDDPHFEEGETLLVEDVLTTLQYLAKFHRQQISIPVLGLTGSNGKTTTKELIASVLATRFRVAFTQGNLNNHIGVPLTILNISEEDEIAVVEMGANHQKEIEFLCSLSQPDYGYITNYGKAHLEGFGGVEGVIKGKSELYDYLRIHANTAFVNTDDALQMEKSQGIKRISFGTSSSADYSIKMTENFGETVSVEFGEIQIHSQLTGAYNFSNLGAAIAIGSHFGISADDIKKGIEAYIPQNNRSQITKTEQNVLIVDTYNANPSSMEQALLNFKTFPGREKWVILGDMFEMGEYEAEEHERIARQALDFGFERVLFAGKAFHQCKIPDHSFLSTDDLLAYLKEAKPYGKTILLKGSRGMKLERALDLL